MNAVRTTGRLRNVRFAAVAALGTALASASHAQPGQPGQEIPPWLDIVVAEAKLGHEADLEDRMREMALAQAGDANAPQASVFQVVSGKPNVYHIVIPRASMAVADTPAASPMPPEQMARWEQRISEATESVRFFVARTYPQFTIAADPNAPEPALLMLRTIQVAPGRQPEYEAWVAQRLMPVLRESNVLGHTMSNGFVGDSPQNFYHAVPLPNWAALDRNPILEALGEQGFQELAQSMAGIVQRDEITVFRPRTDLMGIGEAIGQAQAAQTAAQVPEQALAAQAQGQPAQQGQEQPAQAAAAN